MLDFFGEGYGRLCMYQQDSDYEWRKEVIKLKKMILSAVPVALAGFLCFGGMTGLGQVYAEAGSSVSGNVTAPAMSDEGREEAVRLSEEADRKKRE